MVMLFKFLSGWGKLRIHQNKKTEKEKKSHAYTHENKPKQNKTNRPIGGWMEGCLEGGARSYYVIFRYFFVSVLLRPSDPV